MVLSTRLAEGIKLRCMQQKDAHMDIERERGSNSKLLSKDVATSFQDRGMEIKLHPLSFAEGLQSV